MLWRAAIARMPAPLGIRVLVACGFIVGLALAASVSREQVRLMQVHDEDHNLALAGVLKSPHGVIVPVGPTASVELAVASTSAFRVSVSLSGSPLQLDTPMVDNQTAFAAFSVVRPTATCVGDTPPMTRHCKCA